MSERTCDVLGCDNPPRSSGADWCAKHYHRWYRHGSVDKVSTGSGISVSQGRRYRSVYNPRHPLAKASGRIYEHQVVLFAGIGPGPHPCHWCNKTVRWDAAKGATDRLTVDHLNGLGDDNRLANLVPACPACNSARAIQSRSAALKAEGWWSSHDTVARLASGGRQPLIADSHL